MRVNRKSFWRYNCFRAEGGRCGRSIPPNRRQFRTRRPDCRTDAPERNSFGEARASTPMTASNSGRDRVPGSSLMMRPYTILLSGFRAHAGRRLGVPAILLVLLIPSLANAQELGATGLRDFPADTQQIAYLNMAELRSSPNYFAIHRQLFDHRMDEFEMFLRQIGTDAEKDVDEILLGWRGGNIEREDFFGVASGRFDPQHAHDLAADQGVMVVNYHGAELYGFNAAETNSNLYFTFLDETTAAFGRQTDLKALVDLHQGDGPPLDSNPDFVGWENELEAAAPQWGIATGRAAALQAAPWFAGAGGKVPLDPATVMAPIKAVLYRVDWTSGFT